MASFRFLHDVFSFVRGEKMKRRCAKRQKDEITPNEKMKSRHAKRSQKVSNGVFSHGVFSSFRAGGSRLFVFLHGVFSFFRMAFFCLFFVFSRGVFRIFVFSGTIQPPYKHAVHEHKWLFHAFRWLRFLVPKFLRGCNFQWELYTLHQMIKL